MKVIFTFLFAIILFPGISLAQHNYRNAYVVTLKGDTLKGYILYPGWFTNPSVIRFKSASGEKSVKLTVHDIGSFYLQGIGNYQRYVGVISMDNTSPEHMIDYRDTTYKIDTVFLRVLEKGKNVVLYSYGDAIKDRYFIGIAPDYAPVELRFRLYYDVDHSTLKYRTVYDNTYMKQLFDLAAKYNAMSNELQKDIENSDYHEVYLVEIAKAINKASN